MATIEIDDDVDEAAQVPDEERSQTMKQELALSLYAREILSFGTAHALAELSKREFPELLGERQIPRHDTDEDLAADREYAQ